MPELDDRTLDLLDKQLGRYQQIISRLAGNSVQVKTWCLTATAALTALAIDRDQPAMLGVALLLVITFFYLDAYYLTLERHFRDAATQLGNRAASDDQPSRRELLTIAAPQPADVTPLSILKCGCKAHTALIYVVIVGALLAALVIEIA